MRRGLSLVIVVVWATVAVIASASMAADQPTVEHQFVAFAGTAVASGLVVHARGSGSCWEESLVDGRRFSWRCGHGNEILDPCFSAAAHSSEVVCPARPWSAAVTVLRLTKPLPRWKSYRFNPDFPWGIQTTNHKQCVSYSGSATGDVAGRRVTYGCRGGGFLVGLANRQGRQWTIHYVTGIYARTAVSVGITDAWT